MNLTGSMRREGKGTATGFWKAEKCKGTVASGDAFEAETTGLYLKTGSEEADASGRVKGNHN